MICWMTNEPLRPRQKLAIKHTTRIGPGAGQGHPVPPRRQHPAPRPGDQGARPQRDRPRPAAHHRAAAVRPLLEEPHHRLVHPDRRGDRRHRRRRDDQLRLLSRRVRRKDESTPTDVPSQPARRGTKGAEIHAELASQSRRVGGGESRPISRPRARWSAWSRYHATVAAMPSASGVCSVQPERVEQAHVEQLAGHAVGLGGVPPRLALVADGGRRPSSAISAIVASRPVPTLTCPGRRSARAGAGRRRPCRRRAGTRGAACRCPSW